MNDDEPVVKVTLTTIYTKLLDLDKKFDPVPLTVADHENRIRRLEKQTWRWVGAIAAIIAIAGLAVTFISIVQP